MTCFSMRSFKRTTLCIALLGTALGATTASAQSGADVQKIMPALKQAPLAMPVRSAQQTRQLGLPGAVYSSAWMPAVTAEFARFRQADKSLDFVEALRQGAVRTHDEYQRMRQYLDNAYDGVTVVKTIRVDSQVYDCIPTAEQPALRGGGIVDTPPDRGIPGIVHYSQAGRAESCGAGTVPFARLSLRDVVRYPSLAAFLAKGKQALPASSGARGGGPFTPGGAHHYAVVRTHPGPSNGSGADLNIWNAPVSPATDQYRMSLSQIWLSGRSSSNKTQTLEVGWNVQPKAWGTAKAVPFIYSTQDGYDQTGCYNLECSDFVQTSSDVVFGSAFASNQYSVRGGTQPVMSVEWYRQASSGSWWLAINGNWVGYYPGSLYGTGDLANAGRSLTFDAGGEIAAPDGLPSLPMGSGSFASAGYQQAAFVANMFYIDGNMKGYYSALPKAQLMVADPKCYTLALAGVSATDFPGGLPTGVSTIAPNPQMSGTSFYMGGPGCN